MRRRDVSERHGVGGLEYGRGWRRGLWGWRGWMLGGERGDLSEWRRGGVCVSCGRVALGIGEVRCGEMRWG